MKRFLAVALIALVSIFALDLIAGTGFINSAIETVTDATAADCAGVALATAPLAMVAANINPAENSEKEMAKQKLWIMSDAEFETLRAMYRHLYIINVTFDADERYQFIARRPTKEVIDALAANKGDASKITDILIKNMIVGGDTADLQDGVVYSRVLESLTGIVKEGKKLFTKA